MKFFWTLFLLAISARNAVQQAIPVLALKGSTLAFGYDPNLEHETPFYPSSLRNDHFVVPNVNLTALSNFTIEYWGFTQGTLNCIWDYTTYSQAAVFSGTMSNYFALIAGFGNYSDPGMCAMPNGGSIVGSTGGSIITYNTDQMWCHVSTSIRPSSLGLSHITSRCIGGFNNTKTFSAPALNINANSLMVGRGLMNKTNAVFGELDELRIWNVYKTPEQIAETMYLSLPVDEPNLFAYYRMDDQNLVNPTSTADYTAGGRTGMFSTSPQRPHYTRQFWQGHQMGVTPLRIVKRRTNYNGVVTIPMWFTTYTGGAVVAIGEFLLRPPTFDIAVNMNSTTVLNSTTSTFSLVETFGDGLDFNLTFTATRASCGTQQSGSLRVNITDNNPPMTNSVNFNLVTTALTAEPSPTNIAGISTSGGTVTITGQNFGLNGPFAETESITFQFDDGTNLTCSNAVVSNGGTEIQCSVGAWIGTADVVFNICQQTIQLLDYFTYLGPVINAVDANRTAVVINGENFGPSRSAVTGDFIEIDGQPCNIKSIGQTQIFCFVNYNLTVSEHSLNLTIGGQSVTFVFNITTPEGSTTTGEVNNTTGEGVITTGVGSTSPTDRENKVVPIAVSIVVVVGIAAIVALVLIFFARRRKRSATSESQASENAVSVVDTSYIPLAQVSPLLNKRSVMAVESGFTELKDVTVGAQLGKGNFGEVYKGIAWGSTQVALKKLKSEDCSEFLSEAAMLTNIKHPNCVMFLGVFTDPNQDRYIVTEFCEKGSLLQYFESNLNVLTFPSLAQIAFDAAKGMAYLEEKNVVHRDLAARNLLVDAKGNVKVADFGMSRSLNSNDYYKVADPERAQLPVKWSAPEVLNFHRYTTKSDVWSMGITLYEIFTVGKPPYRGMSNLEVIQNVIDRGYRMPQPLEIPENVWTLISKCLLQQPQDRPSLKEIAAWFNDLVANMDNHQPDIRAPKGSEYAVSIPNNDTKRN